MWPRGEAISQLKGHRSERRCFNHSGISLFLKYGGRHRKLALVLQAANGEAGVTATSRLNIYGPRLNHGRAEEDGRLRTQHLCKSGGPDARGSIKWFLQSLKEALANRKLRMSPCGTEASL